MNQSKRLFQDMTAYGFILLFGVVMVYPLVWLLFASFKPSNEVMNTTALLPSRYVFGNYAAGWYIVKPYTFARFFANTFILVGGCIAGSLAISLVAGYGFARIRFRFRNLWLSLLFLTIMLPGTVTLVSRYMIFSGLGWLNTYLPFIVPSLLGVGQGGGFFIFLMQQFIRGIPIELDEAAKIDGCSTFHIILLIGQLCKPALFSVAIFAFIWNWDDFQNQLIYLSRVKSYTISLALRTTIDVGGTDNWGAIMAMAMLSVVPATVLFFTLQKYFVQGIVSTGIKG
jgi:ABC-type glycerol-3-phosphate transport system permease component